MFDCDINDDFINYEEIIIKNKETIIKMALENVSPSYDGVVQIGVDDGKLFACSLSTGETENPKNRVVEVYRIKQGFDATSCAECLFCDSSNDGEYCNSQQLYECVVDTLTEDFENRQDEIIGDVLNIIDEYIILNEGMVIFDF